MRESETETDRQTDRQAGTDILHRMGKRQRQGEMEMLKYRR